MAQKSTKKGQTKQSINIPQVATTKTYSCPICNHQFSEEHIRDLHLKRVHLVTPVVRPSPSEPIRSAQLLQPKSSTFNSIDSSQININMDDYFDGRYEALKRIALEHDIKFSLQCSYCETKLENIGLIIRHNRVAHPNKAYRCCFEGCHYKCFVGFKLIHHKRMAHRFLKVNVDEKRRIEKQFLSNNREFFLQMDMLYKQFIKKK